MVRKEGNETRVEMGCVVETMMDRCGKESTVGEVMTKLCCCDEAECNNDAFSKKCQEKKVSKSYIISASFVSLVTAIFMSVLMM